MTDPTTPLTVVQGTPEHDRLLHRFWHSDVDTEPCDRLKDRPDYVLQRAAAHERMMTALRKLDERTAA